MHCLIYGSFFALDGYALCVKSSNNYLNHFVAKLSERAQTSKERRYPLATWEVNIEDQHFVGASRWYANDFLRSEYSGKFRSDVVISLVFGYSDYSQCGPSILPSLFHLLSLSHWIDDIRKYLDAAPGSLEPIVAKDTLPKQISEECDECGAELPTAFEETKYTLYEKRRLIVINEGIQGLRLDEFAGHLLSSSYPSWRSFASKKVRAEFGQVSLLSAATHYEIVERETVVDSSDSREESNGASHQPLQRGEPTISDDDTLDGEPEIPHKRSNLLKKIELIGTFADDLRGSAETVYSDGFTIFRLCQEFDFLTLKSNPAFAHYLLMLHFGQSLDNDSDILQLAEDQPEVAAYLLRICIACAMDVAVVDSAYLSLIRELLRRMRLNLDAFSRLSEEISRHDLAGSSEALYRILLADGNES